MKHFIRNISIFALIILLPLIAAELYVRHMPNPAAYKHQWMLQHSTDVQTLVLGSSHTFYGINPSMLGPHTFSLAQPTQPYRYDWYLLRHYPMPKLKRIILPYSYQSLFEDLESTPSLRYWAVRYRLYMDCDIHSPLSQYGFECLHIAPFREKLTSLWRPSQLSWDSLGFGTSYHHQSLIAQGKDNGKQRAKENTYVSQSPKSTPTTTDHNIAEPYLDSISHYCAHHNIQLILITTPTTPSFRANANKQQMAISSHTLHNLLTRYPHIQYHNYTNDPDFHPTDFYDADHLNQLGANKLTRKLSQAIKANQ